MAAGVGADQDVVVPALIAAGQVRLADAQVLEREPLLEDFRRVIRPACDDLFGIRRALVEDLFAALGQPVRPDRRRAQPKATGPMR